MNKNIRLICLTAIVVALMVSTPPLGRAQANEKLPSLTAEIQEVLKNEGLEAAQTRFEAIFPEKKAEYVVDLNEMTSLAGELMQSGEMESAMAVMNMIGAVSAEAMNSSDFLTGMEGAGQDAPQTDQQDTNETFASPGQIDRGPTRTDLSRFHGFYGTSDLAETKRMLFVTESCDGYLVAGAIWGDAQNWWMKSEADNTFSYADSFFNVRMEFEVGDDGNAKAMHHDLDFMPSPLPKHEPLPEDWRACVRPQGG